MRVPIFELVAGTTFKLTWVNSGVSPTDLSMCLLDKDETVVSSVTPVSSGNGHYFAPLYLPTSDAWYVARTIAIIDTRTYVNRGLVRRYKLEAN